MIRQEPIPDGQAFTILERVPTAVCDDGHQAALRVARILAETITEHNQRNKPTVLGLATGHTPIDVYRELIRRHQEERLDLSRVVTFNLDEYYPMHPESVQSYRRWMRENFFDHVNVPDENIHVPDGTIDEKDVAAYCRAYEDNITAAGGIDIQILGIGRTGHIGFNEPGSARESRTRLIALDPVTRRDAAADFFGEANVPRHAITMGVGTILSAKRVLLMAFGEQKAPIIRQAIEEPVNNRVAASFLQKHPNAGIVVDRAAGADLTRIATPWLLGEVEWTPQPRQRAVIWLSLETNKSILKLDQDDYDSHHLASLVRSDGSADELNRRVFRRLSDTIVLRDALPTGQRILCFSPHPDDDVISMGGTISRLIERDNEVHVGYMTSGNIAVADDHALQLVSFWANLNKYFGLDVQRTNEIRDQIRVFLASKSPGQMDSAGVQEIKTLLRRSEAAAACRITGVAEENAHALDLPFYQTGLVRKRPIGPEDVRICLELIRKVKPCWIFVAGELSDPHGTHRLCAEAIYAALKQLDPDERPETVWLYRGAWQEWEPDVIDMALPMSKSELTHKIFGIFKHQSQKDKALFPGPYDDREFWQRAEARNTETASVYNRLGLPEYFAIEAFVRHKGDDQVDPI